MFSVWCFGSEDGFFSSLSCKIAHGVMNPERTSAKPSKCSLGPCGWKTSCSTNWQGVTHKTASSLKPASCPLYQNLRKSAISSWTLALKMWSLALRHFRWSHLTNWNFPWCLLNIFRDGLMISILNIKLTLTIFAVYNTDFSYHLGTVRPTDQPTERIDWYTHSRVPGRGSILQKAPREALGWMGRERLETGTRIFILVFMEIMVRQGKQAYHWLVWVISTGSRHWILSLVVW